ncbi:MAG TPA: hypothetical protein VGL59_12425 [Polyangia bacterium]|jgi:transaldolase
MKVFLHSGDLDEIRHEQKRGLIAGVTVDPTVLAALDDGARRDLLGAIAASCAGPVSVSVRAVTGLPGMLDDAAVLSALGSNLVPALPATPDGWEAMRRCAARGMAAHAIDCQSPADVERGGRAGARWVSPAFVDGPGEGPVLNAARMAEGTRRTYARAASVLLGPLSRPGQALEAAIGGADAVSVVFAALQRLLAGDRRAPAAAAIRS